MDFQPLQLSDIPQIRPFFDQLESRTCDFSVGGMFMWRDLFRMEFALAGDAFFSRLHGNDQKTYYNLPVSGHIEDSLAELIEQEAAAGEAVRFCTIPETYIPMFTKMGRNVSITEQPEFFDYIYAADDLASLRGKKYSGTRNQISQFMRNVDSWEFRQIREEDIEQVRSFFCENYLPTSAAGAYETEENAKVLEVLEHLDAYGMTGGILFADNMIAGFSLNEIIRDTLYTHIEKADRRFKGAYQMLMNQTAVTFAADGILYINREEDMGDLGLRTAKKAYHPLELLKKYVVEVQYGTACTRLGTSAEAKPIPAAMPGREFCQQGKSTPSTSGEPCGTSSNPVHAPPHISPACPSA